MNNLEKKYHENVEINIDSDIINKWRTKSTDFLSYVTSFKKNTKILELGSGRGFLVRYLTNKGYDVMGSDFNKKNIELSYKLNNVRINYVDAENINLNKTFDLVISSDLVEHLYDVESHFEQVKKILKINGYYCFVTPNKYVEKIYNLVAPNKTDQFHISLQTHSLLYDTLTKLGFNVFFLKMNEITLAQKSKIGAWAYFVPVRYVPKIVQPSIICIAKKKP